MLLDAYTRMPDGGITSEIFPNVSLSGVRGLLFDLDGVLINSTSCHRDAFEQVFMTLGIRDFSYPRYGGWRTADVIQDVLKRAGHHAPPETIVAMAREKTRLARLMLERRRPLAQECEATLARLAADYPLALASCGSRSSVESFLQMTGSGSLFQSVLSGEDVKFGKPDPEIYLRSAQRLGLNASDCLVVEDSKAGVEAARAAGALVAGIPGSSSASELREAGASYIASDLRELATTVLSALPARRNIDPNLWTAVIPAAGRGTRLGFDRPKILYPVAGRLILDWLLDFLTPYCAKLVFVLSPQGATEVTEELQRRIPRRFEIVVQATPTGMGDAVALALPKVRTPNVAVVWGDQVALKRRSVELCLRLHQSTLSPDVTFPTLIRSLPYIHFERDSAGQISGLRQSREGDAMPENGESDAGFFCFSSGSLSRMLQKLHSSGAGLGRNTGEFNLLPVIPLAAAEGRVLSPRIVGEEETVGVNSVEDAAGLEDFLRRSDGHQS